jgi:hypothetical protein
MLSMAPAATAVVAAMTSAENPLKREYPSTATALPVDKNTAATATALTAPASIIVMPMAMDSGIPSISAPSAWPGESLGCRPPKAGHVIACDS